MMKRVFYLIPSIIFTYAGMTCFHIPSNMYTGQAVAQLGSLSGALRQPSFAGMNPVVSYSQGFESASPSGGSSSGNYANYKTENNSVRRFYTNPVSPVDMYNLPLPKFTRGIYLNNATAYSLSKLTKFIEEAKSYDINTFVIDVQKKMIPRTHLDKIKDHGIYPVARIVVFQGGLKDKDVSKEYLDSIIQTMEDAAFQGFLEIQLDYIRYADDPELLKIPLSYKYATISSILERARKKADEMSVFLSADLFGRVTLHQNDHIGQKLEHFARYTDTIYPMLYPSHYTNDDYRISNPYETVREGVEKSRERCPDTRIVAYIQGFDMKISGSGKTLSDYILAQIEGVADARGSGWIIWDARNRYTESYTAIENFQRNNRLSQVILSQPPVL